MIHDALFAQPGLTCTEVTETHDFVTFHVALTPTQCPDCGATDARIHANGNAKKSIVDTPARGKKAELRVNRKRMKCRNCAAVFSGELKHIDPELGMTNRAIEYVQCLAPRRTKADIAVQIGAPVAKVSRIIDRLIDCLEQNHTFETPRVLGIDDLRLCGKTYTVLTNGETGEPVGFLDASLASDITQWIVGNLDRTRVEYLVSDLGLVNIAVLKQAWPTKPSQRNFIGHQPLHIADKFHVLKAAQKALNGTVNAELNRLRNEGGTMAGEADILDWLRPHLLRAMPSRGIPECEDEPAQMEFSFVRNIMDKEQISQGIDLLLKRNTTISRAFWARMRLQRLYASDDLTTAEIHADSFLRQTQSPEIAEKFAAARSQFVKHRELILNYFRATSESSADGILRVTNNPTENRNSKIRAAWRAAHGIKNFRYLRFRALYEPVDIRRILASLG